MTSVTDHWSKRELEVYILLLCALADSNAAQAELDLIHSKTDGPTFYKMAQEISGDSEKKSLKKIRKNIVYHDYSIQEIGNLRREMDEVFRADQVYVTKERLMNEVLQNIIY
ncbi:hypothetical protein [Nonlabens marinus]|uniref:Uncharacterized protein n=1 Tax=Nonlabens marinus S1-08 TaxID=1454201 RepID=W8VXI3_9FLAO|nr:hypothetical protein [Nonlabens marinus]BAO55977.1 hypothetical protein NMS_1968 [Nonlabens marinus S1-08]